MLHKFLLKSACDLHCYSQDVLLQSGVLVPPNVANLFLSCAVDGVPYAPHANQVFCNQRGATDEACMEAASNATVITGGNVEKLR